MHHLLYGCLLTQHCSKKIVAALPIPQLIGSLYFSDSLVIYMKTSSFAHARYKTSVLTKIYRPKGTNNISRPCPSSWKKKKDVGMACQKVCKLGRDDAWKQRSTYWQSPIPTSFTTVRQHPWELNLLPSMQLSMLCISIWALLITMTSLQFTQAGSRLYQRHVWSATVNTDLWYSIIKAHGMV